MAIGPILQEARQKKKLTASQVAELTRMKVQIVDDLEHDDFHRLAATIYGKGFIRLFAECVGLDPAPLIADYMRTVQGGGRVPAAPVAPAAPAVAARTGGPGPAETHPPEPEPETEPEDLFAFASSHRKRITPAAPNVRAAEAAMSASPSAGTAPRVPKHRTRSERESFPLVAARLLTGLRARGAILTEAVKDRLAAIKWSDRFLKILGIALAAIALILVLVTVVRHLAARSGSRPPADHELILFTPLPEPYVDR